MTWFILRMNHLKLRPLTKDLRELTMFVYEEKYLLVVTATIIEIDDLFLYCKTNFLNSNLVWKT